MKRNVARAADFNGNSASRFRRVFIIWSHCAAAEETKVIPAQEEAVTNEMTATRDIGYRIYSIYTHALRFAFMRPIGRSVRGRFMRISSTMSNPHAKTPLIPVGLPAYSPVYQKKIPFQRNFPEMIRSLAKVYVVCTNGIIPVTLPIRYKRERFACTSS